MTAASDDGAPPGDGDSVFFRAPRQRRNVSGLSLERIIIAAVALLDREGPSALTMRKVAAELGVHATSLYWYVDRREDLGDLAVDRVLAEAAAAPAATGDWDAVVTYEARSLHDALAARTWVAPFAGARPLVGPNALTISGRILAGLASTGAPEHKLTVAAASISNLILGSITAAAAAASLGLTDPESPLARAVVESVRTVQEPPATSAAWTPMFDESLDLLMIGIRALLAR